MRLTAFFESLNEGESVGTFVGARVTRDSERKLTQWMRDNGLRKKEPQSRLHITVLSDKNTPFDWEPVKFDPPLEVNQNTYKLERLGEDGKALVLSFACPELEKRHHEGREKHAIDWPHPTYHPHITLSMDPTKLNDDRKLRLPTFPIYVQTEYVQPYEFNGKPETNRRREERAEECSGCTGRISENASDTSAE